MAITWEVKITVLNVERKEISLMATRTDSEDLDNPKTYSVLSGLIQTGQQKLDLMDNIWSQYQTDKTKQVAIDAFMGNLETDAKDNLEARE